MAGAKIERRLYALRRSCLPSAMCGECRELRPCIELSLGGTVYVGTRLCGDCMRQLGADCVEAAVEDEPQRFATVRELFATAPADEGADLAPILKRSIEWAERRKRGEDER